MSKFEPGVVVHIIGEDYRLRGTILRTYDEVEMAIVDVGNNDVMKVSYDKLDLEAEYEGEHEEPEEKTITREEFREKVTSHISKGMKDGRMKGFLPLAFTKFAFELENILFGEE